MAIAPTAEYQDLVMEVEFTAGSGTYTRVCGLTNITINRSKNMADSQVPDCADESLPHYIKRAAQSKDIGISATGVWALTHHQKVYNWWSQDLTLNVRVTNAKVTSDGVSGDTESEVIPMKLESLNNARQDKQVVSAEISLVQDGAVTLNTLSA
ncbi:phage tail protein [Mameliella sp. CS4]|uniref:phage tail tube protein n=1 Tax=Mameliella sp. CS4 TaxID=2862329 RepID=UPI001C600C9A|nr:phage tail tube protein [Mameliella sp. CS4]MBW4985076.1 phage tail protein [Mameliella sp. CS4]